MDTWTDVGQAEIKTDRKMLDRQMGRCKTDRKKDRQKNVRHTNG